MTEEELAAQAAAQAAAAQGTPPPAEPAPEPAPPLPPAEPAGGTPPAPPAAPPNPAAPPAMNISLEQVVQAMQMLAQGMDALKQDYLKTKEIVSSVVVSLDENAEANNQAAFLAELDELGEEYKLSKEEKKLFYDDYQALVKEAGDKAPSALEYFKTYVPQMTKGTSERMARLDSILQALAEKEAAEKAANETADAETAEQEKWNKLKEAM